MTRTTENKPRAEDGAMLHWVAGPPPKTTPAGAAFGVPWAKGEIDKTVALAATTASGKRVPLQSWPLAYWPDGSLKWSGHALAADSALEPSLSISPGDPLEPSAPVSVTQEASQITIKTGSFTAVLGTSGSTLVQSLSVNGTPKATAGALVAHVQLGPDPEPGFSAPKVASLRGNIESVKVEQSGPVRAVVKVMGKYSGADHAAFLPFTARLYVAAGGSAVRVVHFFVYDGDQNADFIKGLGLAFAAPMSGALYDRHVRFPTAAGGLFAEPVQGLSGLRRDATAPVLNPQFAGQPVPPVSAWPATVSAGLADIPVWPDFRLDQLSADRFTVQKRTQGSKVKWVDVTQGSRAAGVGYVGTAGVGGVAWALRESWERASTGVDVGGLSGEEAAVSVWAYSPRAPAMDMRPYDTKPHGLDLTYEDVGNPDPDPTGIGRSYDLTITAFTATPSRDAFADLAATNVNTPQLVASPEFYAAHKLFGGRWNVPNTSRSGLAKIEKQKSDLLDFYIAEVEQRKWYGFWDYGDVMHTYDQTRHVWRYDVGGYAWDNGELGTDLWLWESFLRTGRADVWRMASAMTRHISESDVHHTGTFAGLGSRHHVSHWGDGAKEARVAGAMLRRPLYYISADELLGDLMESTLQVDETIVRWEPLRKVTGLPPFSTPGRVRIGPDWTALAGNWFAQWERTGDAQWLARLKTGMRDIAAMQYGFFSGNSNAVGWDPETAHLTDLGGEAGGSYHLTMIFGGGEFIMELVDTVTDIPEFDAAWLDYCKYWNATAAEQTARYGKSFKTTSFNQLYAKLQAYAGERLNDTKLKQGAWDVLNKNVTGIWPAPTKVGGTDVVNPTNEIVNLATNDAASLSLSEYAVIAIAPELAPNSFVAESRVEEWDHSTLGGSIDEKAAEKEGEEERREEKGKGPMWKRMLCL